MNIFGRKPAPERAVSPEPTEPNWGMLTFGNNWELHGHYPIRAHYFHAETVEELLFLASDFLEQFEDPDVLSVQVNPLDDRYSLSLFLGI